MDYHITWYKCFPHWYEVQWPRPGSITQRSRSHKTFKGQEYTCSCSRYNLPMHWSFGRGYSRPIVCLHFLKMVQKSLLRPCRFKMFYWWIFTVCSVFERNDFDDGVEGKMVGKSCMCFWVRKQIQPFCIHSSFLMMVQKSLFEALSI